tara:strand:+ start:727 stop:2499 length:1773 start_codon:yes stop_codon:yes gene_type:complete
MAIKIPIFADYNDRGVRQAETSFSKFGKNVGDITKKAAAAFAGVAVAVGAGAVKAIDMASDLAESQSKVAQIFGESGAAIEAFSKTAATSLGLSQQNVLDAAGTFGIFGKAAGLGGKDLSDFSNNFTTLSSDLASFNNTSPEDAINAIGSALRGEMEPIRRYGVMLDDAAIKAEAMAQGLYDGKGPLKAQAKTLAITALIYKKTSDAQGDFAKTSGGLANQTKIMKAQLTNAATTIGTALLPIAMKLASFFANNVIPAVQKLSEVFSEKGLTGVLDLAKQQLPKLQEAFSSLWNWITTVGVPKFVALMKSLGKALVDWIGPRIMPMLKKLGELIGKAANWIYTVGIPALVDKLILLGDAFVAWITPLIGPMLKKLGEVFVVVANWLVTVGAPALVKAAVKLADALIGWAFKMAGPLLKGLALLLLDIGKWVFTDGIPALAKLGVQLGLGLINALVSALKGLGSMGLDIGKSFANGIIDFINREVIDSINNLLQFTIDPPGPGPTLTINPPDLPHIPTLAAGGIVTRPTLAMIGEAGAEAVIPLTGRNAGMGMGVTNYITINSGADPQAVVRALQNYNRTSGPVPVNTRAN